MPARKGPRKAKVVHKGAKKAAAKKPAVRRRPKPVDSDSPFGKRESVPGSAPPFGETDVR
jgi:hypothetical protein